MKTTYKEVPGFDGYRVGSDGTVWSRRGRWPSQRKWRKLKPYLGSQGYLVVALHGQGQQQTRTVHSLILLTFVGPLPKGCESRHLNGVRSDNRLDNLAYGTYEENQADKLLHGTHHCGEKVSHFVKLTSQTVTAIRAQAAGGRSLASLGREYGVTVGNVHAIVHRKSWKHI